MLYCMLPDLCCQYDVLNVGLALVMYSILPPSLLPSSDVPAWLKSLRLHKYQHLFADLNYEEMLQMKEDYLEEKVFI